MERTTLTRNLRPIEKQGLVKITPGEDQRSRVSKYQDMSLRIFLKALKVMGRNPRPSLAIPNAALLTKSYKENIVEELFIPLSLTMGIIGWGTVALWFAVPALDRIPRRDALAALIIPHVFRYVGLGFLVTGVTAEALDLRFAQPAAYGDLIAAVLAVIALAALRGRWSATTASVWIFNILGTLDLLFALTQGMRFTEPSWMGATYFIPAVAVPMLLVSHWLVFRELRRKRDAS